MTPVSGYVSGAQRQDLTRRVVVAAGHNGNGMIGECVADAALNERTSGLTYPFFAQRPGARDTTARLVRTMFGHAPQSRTQKRAAA